MTCKVKKEVRGPYWCKAPTAYAGEGFPRLTI